jgi:hypothetical protein
MVARRIYEREKPGSKAASREGDGPSANLPQGFRKPAQKWIIGIAATA